MIIWTDSDSRTVSNPNGITACAYSYDGSMLVYAKGYNWDFVF